MDNLEYLQKISQSNRPVKRTNPVKAKLLDTSIIKIALGGIVLFLLLMILGGMLSSLNAKPENLTKQLYTRTENLNSVLNTYNSSLKSSKLRSIGTSLSGVLTNSSNQLSVYIMDEENNHELLKPDEVTLEAENLHLAELNTSLNNAKLNGILDRAYANQIGLEVSLLLSMISELSERAGDDRVLQDILTTYHNNLETIHNSFENYSEL